MICVERPPAGATAGTIVLLHGRGADERDLQPLLSALDPDRRLRGITVGGPLAFPAGGRAWYVIDRVGHPDPATFAATYTELAAFLDDELALDWSTTVVGGFSQGAVMAYALGLGPVRPVPAGVLAMSCFLPTVPGWAPDLSSRSDLHVAHVHGTGDPIISVEFARAARATIQAGGLPLLYREFPGGHQVDPDVLPELAAWVAARTGG